MPKVVLDDIASGYDLSKINTNFQKIEDELNDKVLYRNPPIGETNTIQKDIDFNSKKLLNLPYPSSNSEPVTKGFLQDEFGDGAFTQAQAAEASAIAAQASANAAALSSSNADTSEANAATSASNAATSESNINGAIVAERSAVATLSNKTLTLAELGSSTAATQSVGDISTKVATTAFVSAAITASAGSDKLQPITATFNANAMTVTLNPTTLDFHSGVSETTGVPVTRTIASPISVVVSSGSTLGVTSAERAWLVVYAIQNGATVELAIGNLKGAANFDEANLISTTTEGGAGAADSATTIYSTTARSNVQYRIVGYLRGTFTTAGTWVTPGDFRVQSAGGMSLPGLFLAMGFAQTPAFLIGSRVLGTTYFNVSNRTRTVWVSCTGTPNGGNFTSTINGVVTGTYGTAAIASGSSSATATLIVPPGQSYRCDNGTGMVLQNWVELV